MSSYYPPRPQTGGIRPSTPQTGGIKQLATGGLDPSPVRQQGGTYTPGGYFPPAFNGTPTQVQSQPWHGMVGVQPWVPPGYAGAEPTGFQGPEEQPFVPSTPQTGGIRPPSGVAGAASVSGDPGPGPGDRRRRINPETGIPERWDPEQEMWVPIRESGGPGTENPNPQYGPTPGQNDGMVDCGYDAEGNVIPGTERVTSDECDRRFGIRQQNVPQPGPLNPPETPGGGGGTPSPGPIRNTAAPTPTAFTPTPAPEFQPPTFTPPPAYQAPTFEWNRRFEAPEWNWNREFQAPQWNFNRTLDAPDFTWTEEFKAPTFEEAMNDPGYQFRLQEGMRALENNAAAKGALRTGGTLKGLSDYAARSASQEYQNVFDRYKTGYDTRFDTERARYGADYQEAFDEYQAELEKERNRYMAAFQGAEGEYDRGFDAYRAGYGADYQRATDQYNKAFEAFLAQFAANYQGSRDEYQSAFDIAREQFDTEFAAEQARFNPRMQEWMTNETNRQRDLEAENEFRRQMWFWNNPSATTIFQAGAR